MRLAYADPPYPGKAHLYPENEEVDHGELIGRLCEYDGWALSTDETNLAAVLALCPPGVRILAWCRVNAMPMRPKPWAQWEPVLLKSARPLEGIGVSSFLTDRAMNSPSDGAEYVGRKTYAFCEWIVRCLGAELGDSLDDLFPGKGTMSGAFEAVLSQPPLFSYNPSRGGPRAREQAAKRNIEPLFATAPGRDKAIYHGKPQPTA